MVRVLQPWFENLKKRQVKTPKNYFKDPGLFNALASVHSLQDLTLDHLYIVYPGTIKFLMDENITICGLSLLSQFDI